MAGRAPTGGDGGTQGALARVLIFARAPEPGRVKTRLQGAVGPEGAARLAEAFLRDTWDATVALPWARPVVATTGPLEPDLGVLEAWDQGGGDLGARIERMLERALSEAALGIAIGADSPGLPRRLLEDARRALEAFDAVLGPSADGGFYLVGLRRWAPGLFEGLPWSADDTFTRTRDQLRERGLSVAVLDPWFDVDRPADLDRLRGALAEGLVEAPATARVLAELDGDPGPLDGRAGRAAGAAGGAAAPGATRAAPGLRIAVIIPTLNEEARIATRLRELEHTPGLHELLVVDGGSSDRTVELARAVPGVRVLESPRGRSRQMNRGAAASGADVLLFLHADVALPLDAAAWVRRALGDPGVVAGAFRTRTVADGAPSRLAPLLRLADLRSRWSSVPYGDQALFVRAPVFRDVGGFPDLPLMEDLELSRRLGRRGRVRTVPADVRVSGRRFIARPIYYTALVNVLPLLFRLGIPLRLLARLYGAPR